VNFGTAAFFAIGSYTAVVLFKWLGAPLAVQIAAAAAVSGLLGFGVGLLTLRLRGIFFAIATVAIIFIMETMMMNWRYVGGATGLQLLRPDVLPPFASYTRCSSRDGAARGDRRVGRALRAGLVDRPRACARSATRRRPPSARACRRSS
jgi:ABC-type branched-subunit amino acid transport system permease subunit